MTEEKIKPLIQEEVKSSMKKGDREKTTTLRMAISEIKKEENKIIKEEKKLIRSLLVNLMENLIY